GLLKRYGWIAVVAVVLLVGGAAYVEYKKAQEQAQAEALGDALLAALAVEDTAARAEQLAQIDATGSRAGAVVGFLTAADQVEAGDYAAAVDTLNAIVVNGEVPEIYRQIAQFKAATLHGSDTPVAERRQSLEALAQPGNPFRLLATEQLALLEVAENNPEAAIATYQSIVSDAEVSPDLQQRALQVIVALGGEPADTSAPAEPGPDMQNETPNDTSNDTN
ncbi:MAG: tetratricopeptide repeat protein, partial [Jannaschia sp.]